MRTIHPHLHGANVDLKAFREEFYQKRCGGRLEGVLQFAAGYEGSRGVGGDHHPDYPGSERFGRANCASWPSLSSPWARRPPGTSAVFIPCTRCWTALPLPSGFWSEARKIGLEAGLRYVYTGNVPGDAGEDTYCYIAGSSWWIVWGFRFESTRLKDKRCYPLRVIDRWSGPLKDFRVREVHRRRFKAAGSWTRLGTQSAGEPLESWTNLS